MPIINDNFTVRAPVPIDDRLGWWDGSDWQPFTSRQDALDKTKFYRYITLTLPVVEDGDVVEYWFKGGITDDDFVLKTFEVDLSEYYTKTELQTSGSAEVHWDNITNVPSFATDWGSITGDQSVVGNAGFTNDAGYITLGDIPAPDYSTLPGFGLSWNSDTNKIDWGTSIELGGIIIREADLPNNELFSIGSGFFDQGPKIFVQKAFGIEQVAIAIGDLNSGQYSSVGVSNNGSETTISFSTVGRIVTLFSDRALEYDSDYSAFYTNRSLVDKEYVDGLIPDLSGYATESWVESKGYIDNVTSSWDVNTGNLTIQGIVNNLDGRYMLRSNTLTSGYGIIASADFMNPVSIEIDTGVIDNRYLRKDQDDDNSTNNLTLGSLLTLGDTEVRGDLILPNLMRGATDDQVLLRNPSNNTVRYLSLSNVQSSFSVANSAGVNQFAIGSGDFLRFNATGDATIAFNSSTKTITINSTGGSSGGGGVTSWNARTGDVVPENGDYTTTLVSEGTNQYFTQARVRSTPLTGFLATNSAIVENITVLQALGRAQGQINARVPTSRSISINGTSGNITVSGGTQTLAANRTWTINLANKGTAGTYTKVTTDAQGRVSSGTSLVLGDMPNGVIQSLSLGSSAGEISISGSNSVSLSSLQRRSISSFEDDSNIPIGFHNVYNTTGSTGYPSGGLGAGIRVLRGKSGNARTGSFELWKRNDNTDQLWLNTGNSTGWNGWKVLADRNWVTSQIPTNYVTTNTNQTGLSGTKSWTAAHSWTSTAGAPSASNAVQVGGSSNGQYLRIQKQGEATQSIIVRGYEIDGVQLVLNEGGLDGPQGSNSTNTPILFAGGNPLLGRSTVGALSLMAWNNNLILKPNGTSTDGQVIIATTGQVTVAGLSGSGTQMVVANGSGVLSRRAIPAVGVTSVDAGNGMNFTTITGSGSVTLGTPGNITLSSTNSVTSTSHTHNFAPGGTTAQYIRGDGSLATFPSIPAGDITGVTAGTGLSGGGTSGTVTLNIAAAYSPNTSSSLGSANLNTITTPGFYHQTSSSNATTARNYPASVAGNLQVYKDPGVTQRYNVYNTGATYVRNYYSSSWTAWTRVDYRSHTHTWGSLTGTIGTIPGAGASGTYGSLNISGLKQGYAGINFADVGNALFMVNASARSGLYKGGWVWAFEGDGTLYAGTVPWARLTGVPTIIPTSRTISAGNGLTGGGSLAANRTITLATPGTITGSTTNSVSASSHTHSLTLASGDITGALGFTPVTTARTITMTGGSGITSSAGSQTLAGNRTWTISLTSITAGSGTVGALRYSGTTRTTGQMYGGSTNPNGTTRLNYSGILHAYDFIGYGSSDERLKDHITPIVDPIGKLSQLGGYSFKWKPGHDSYQGNDYGLIAQEVEKVLPEIVVERGGVKAIKTGNQLIGLLVAGFNELSKRVEALENGIS